MNNTVVPPKLHPALLVAAVSVTIFSLVGIGVLTGVIPGKQAEPPAAVQTAAPAPAPAAAVPAPAAAVPAPQAAAPAPVAAPAPAPKPVAKVARAPVKKEVPSASEAGLPPPPPAPVAGAVPPSQPADFCRDCGTIESVREVTQKGEGTGLGAIAGGVAGGVLGNQIGGGRGRDAATVLGILGGAVAGHQVEKSVRKTAHYEITVHMDDGGSRTINSETPPAWRTGDRVRVVNGALIAK